MPGHWGASALGAGGDDCGLRIEDLYGVTNDDVVPSGVAEIARLQGMGYVYEHP